MRISGGVAKGRKIGAGLLSGKKQGTELRPTSAKVREAVFDILRDKVIGAVFLDLYAGTGAVGIEALSRGAEKTIFVEENPARIKVLKGLLDRIGFKDNTIAVLSRAVEFIKKTEEVFDVIFLDPPYASGELETVLNMICTRCILKDMGMVVAEHSSKKALPAEIGQLKLKKIYKYGDTALSVYNIKTGKGL